MSAFSGNLDLDFPLCNAKRAPEQRLRESGLSYTILRPYQSGFGPNCISRTMRPFAHLDVKLPRALSAVRSAMI